MPSISEGPGTAAANKCAMCVRVPMSGFLAGVHACNTKEFATHSMSSISHGQILLVGVGLHSTTCATQV